MTLWVIREPTPVAPVTTVVETYLLSRFPSCNEQGIRGSCRLLLPLSWVTHPWESAIRARFTQASPPYPTCPVQRSRDQMIQRIPFKYPPKAQLG